MGGVLFIDEAYTLCNGGDDQYGHEAVDTLMRRMENDRGKFVVIIAGYKDRIDAFLSENQGLASRFTHTFMMRSIMSSSISEKSLVFSNGSPAPPSIRSTIA